MQLVIQEGGTTWELYSHLFDRVRDAEQYRTSCANDGSCRTTPALKVPFRLAAALRADPKLEADFVEFLQEAVRSVGDVDMPEEDDG
jgi:hypothetical protein